MKCLMFADNQFSPELDQLGVPEPSTGLLAALACGLMWWKRKSFSRVSNASADYRKELR
jgi:hypothetical protein